MVEIASKTFSCLVPAIVNIMQQKLRNIKNTLCTNEGTTNMDKVVNTDYNGKDNRDTGDDIDGDIPEMKESNNISESEDHKQDDQDTDIDVIEKKKSDKDDTEQSHTNISPEFKLDYIICIPSSIDFAVTKFVCRVCRINHFSH